MVIKLTNVSKVIKKAKVLDNVNLELTSGKVYGLKGKNGKIAICYECVKHTSGRSHTHVGM